MSFVALSWCFRRTVFFAAAPVRWRLVRGFFFGFAFFFGFVRIPWAMLSRRVQCWLLSSRQLASNAMRIGAARARERAMLLALPVQCQCRARRRCDLLLLALLYIDAVALRNKSIRFRVRSVRTAMRRSAASTASSSLRAPAAVLGADEPSGPSRSPTPTTRRLNPAR